MHALKLAIINPEVWEKYEEWLEEVIKDGTDIARHKEDEIPVFQSKGIGDYKMEDTVHESKDLDL